MLSLGWQAEAFQQSRPINTHAQSSAATVSLLKITDQTKQGLGKQAKSLADNSSIHPNL